MGVPLLVQIYRGGQAVAQQQFDSDANRTIKIGRLSSAQIKLEDAKVSRIHAVLEFAGNDVSLIDMGSTEGTLVNGAKIHKVKINSGDQVGIGDSVLIVSYGAGAMAAATTVVGALPAFDAAATRVAPMPGAYDSAATRVAAMPGAYDQAATRVAAMPAYGSPAFAAAPAMGGQTVVAPQAAFAGAPAPSLHQPRFDPGASTDAAAPMRRMSQDRLHSAAVESKPHPALAPEEPLSADSRVLEMRFYWGEVLLGMHHYDKPKRITLGETKSTNIFISSEGLPVEEFPLIRYMDDDYVLTFAGAMEGEFETGGSIQSLNALRGSSSARRDDHISESYQVKMGVDSRALVHWGGATFALRFVPPPKMLPKKLFDNVDLQFLNLLIASFFLHLVAVVTCLVYPYDTELLKEDLFDKPDRFANLILEPPKQTESNKNLLEKLKKDIEPKKEEEKPKEKPPEIKVTQKIPQNIKPQKTQQQKEAEVQQKFSKLFSGSGEGAGSLLGGGGGGSITGTLSNVIGTAGAGSSTAGLAGLGIRGTGPMTGGGIGTSRGIAGIGTSGRLGGGGLAYGSGVGLGASKDRGMIDIGSPVVMGALPPDVIKKVINENKNQIRYCYEIELQRNQNLEGRVAMSWVIAATGAVATAKVKESTMNNSRVENCIVSKILTWKFPPPAGGGIVQVNYPFVLKAS